MLRKLISQLISIITLVILDAILLTSISQAKTHSLYANRGAEVNDLADTMSVERKALLCRYGYFIDDSMNDAYNNQFGFMFFGGGEGVDKDKIDGRWSGGRVEFGLLMASGKPLKRYSNFEIVDESLKMVALPFSITIMSEFTDFNRSDFMTYWGLGFGFFFGFERMACHVTKETATVIEDFEWHDTCYRHSFAGHGLVGINWDVSEEFSFLCELRWTQGGKGRLKRAVLDKEAKEAGFEEVFADFQHPDFNFTGASLDIGVKW